MEALTPAAIATLNRLVQPNTPKGIVTSVELFQDYEADAQGSLLQVWVSYQSGEKAEYWLGHDGGLIERIQPETVTKVKP